MILGKLHIYNINFGPKKKKKKMTAYKNLRLNMVAPYIGLYKASKGFAEATLFGRMNDAHNIHFPGATRRTLRISTSTTTSDSAILIL